MLLAINTTLQILHLRSLMLNDSVTGAGRELSGYIIPLSDAHFGSRIATCDQRLQFISGFTGSAGSAIITTNHALLWTDGRYFTQAVDELDENWELMRDGLPDTPSQGDFLVRNLTRGSLIGVDPYLYSKTDFDALQNSIRLGGHSLVPVERNLVDLTWSNRPPCPNNPVFPLEVNFTGRTTAQKLDDVRAEMTTAGADAVVLSELDEIAWLLNLRGADLESSSVFISYLIIRNDSFQFFINAAKLSQNVTSAIQNDGGEIFGYDEIGAKLSELSNTTTGKIWFSNKCNYALVGRVPAIRQIVNLTPLALLKAVKNDVEAEGMRTALIKDAAAVVRFLSWLEGAVTGGQNITEMSAAARLLQFRQENDNFLTTSFSTISGSGSNGAIIHYRPSEATNKQITTSEMYLVDSGAIYREGTTDITRTVHFGTPTDFQKECYTRVLKGQIGIATAKFPSKMRASRIDAFARRSLWQFGLEYNHGTGHGIGHALNVHEGPSYIRSYHIPDDQGYRANMFTSNEPGYYQEGEFGIRLENIIRVINVTLDNNFLNQGFLGFEDLTFVPYRHNLIKTELLTGQEVMMDGGGGFITVAYLNDYQEKTRNVVGEFIRSKFPEEVTSYEWLIKETPTLTVSPQTGIFN